MLDLEKMSSYQLLNYEQCCLILGISKSSFYNLVNMGELPAKRAGPRAGIRVKVEDLRTYMSKADVEA